MIVMQAQNAIVFSISYLTSNKKECEHYFAISHRRRRYNNRPTKIPVLPEIMRACLKVTWLNICIDCQVFTIILTYITCVRLH